MSKNADPNFRDLFETIDLGVVYQDRTGKIIHVNLAAENILGLSHKQILALDSHSEYWQAVKEDGTPFTRDQHPAMVALMTGRRVNNVVMGIFHNRLQQQRWIKINSVPEFIKGSKTAVRVYTSFYDITDRKRVENEIRESEQKFRYLAEESPNMIFINLRGKVVYANKSCIQYTGYTLKEVYSNDFNFLTLIDKNDIPAVNENFRKHSMGLDVPPYEYRLISKNGKKLDVIISTKLIDYHKQKAILGIVTDITIQKNAKRVIIESEKRFRSMIEHSSDAITLVDAEGNIKYDSPQVESITGFSPEERIGKKGTDFIFPDDLSFFENKSNQVCSLSGSSLRYEYRSIRKDGTVWWAEGSITNLLHEPSVEAIVMNYRDITERKNTEEQIYRQSNEYQKLSEIYQAQNEELIGSLERIQKINSDLELARLKAEESDRLKTAFLSNMSHEIRTPMNGILGFSELLKEAELTGSQKQKYIDVIQLSGRRMLNIINDLIDISKIESGQMEINIADVNLSQLLDKLYNVFRSEAENKGLEFVCNKNFENRSITIATDESKISQVFSNLIRNALKFTRQGRVEFGYVVKKGVPEFFVSDTGIGIPVDLHKVIFERFRQGDNSDKRNYDGSGLGLSISKAFIEMLGGRIWLVSKPGEGSLFCFTIPLVVSPDHSEKGAASVKTSRNPLRGKTILIAEDDHVSFMFLKEILTRKGATVIHAENGRIAVENVKSSDQIDLVLMDLKMPELDGVEATKQIKKMKPELPVIVQTAYAFAYEKNSKMEMNCNDYVSKPVDRKLLLEKIMKHTHVKIHNKLT
jgi:PAS domain S-box-containing protein